MDQEISQIPLLNHQDIEKMLSMINLRHFTIIKTWTEPVDQLVGLCGDHSLLCVKFKEEKITKTVSFFVKQFPKLPALAKYAEDTQSFVKETFIFQLFHKITHEEDIKILADCIPKCYLTISDKLLIFKNLIEAGYQQCNKYEPLDYDTIKSVLESLAKLHASTLIYEEKQTDKIGKPYRLIDEYESNFKETYFSEDKDSYVYKSSTSAIVGILNMVEIFDFPQKLLSGKRFVDVLKQICYKPFDLVKPSSKHRNVINHGDIWATNFMIKSTGNQKICKLVDFQVARYVPPAQDVMAAIYLTTSREFRKEHMYNLIGVYYNFLEKYVKIGGYSISGILPFSEFLESCEEQKVFALIETAIYLPFVLLTTEQLKEALSEDGFSKKAMLEDRSLLILKYKDNYSSYIRRIKDSMEDLKDYCDYL